MHNREIIQKALIKKIDLDVAVTIMATLRNKKLKSFNERTLKVVMKNNGVSSQDIETVLSEIRKIEEENNGH